MTPPPARLHCAPPSTASTEPVVKLDARSRSRGRPRTARPGCPARRSGNVLRALGERLVVPVPADVGQERSRHDGVDPDLRAECVGETDRQRVETRLRRRVGQDVVRRPHAPDRADVDDRPAAVSLPSVGRRATSEPERALEVDGDHLVPQLLGDARGSAIRRGDPGVVDEHVDPPELLVGGIDERLDVVPVGRRGRGRQEPRRPARRTSSAVSSHASCLRLATRCPLPPARAWPRSRGRGPSLRP